MPRVIRREYNRAMRRLLALVAAAWLVLAPAPTALADDPRCADWEQHGAPAGIDLHLVCTANQVIGAYTGQAGADVNSEPLLPYVVGLLVTGIGLAMVGVVATRVVGRKAGKRLAPERPDAWWVCPSCQSVNAEGRPACYACHAPRADAPSEGAAEPMVMRRVD
jgi:hypothetical protein